MLDSFLSSPLVICAQSGDAKDIHSHFPEFTAELYDFCHLPGVFEQKRTTLHCLEHLLIILACRYEEVCTSCQKQLLHIVEFVRDAKNSLVNDDGSGESHAPPTDSDAIHIISMKWPGTRIEFCENIYIDYSNGLYMRSDGTQMSLSDVLKNQNALYGMDVTYDELTSTHSKIKARKGVGYPEHRDKIATRGYFAYKKQQAYEEFLIEQEDKDGRKMPPPKYRK